MNQYCPIFFFPSLCFTTYEIPMINLPFNLGPFVLLILTKFILPRSSLIGHLSGIIIGYPLAWNTLNWLTPPIFCSACILIYIHIESLYAYLLPCFEMSTNLSDFVNNLQLRKFYILKFQFVLICLFAPCFVLLFGLIEIFPRLMQCFLVWNAYQARRVEWLTEQRNAQQNASYMILLAMLHTAVLVTGDIATCATILSNWTEINASGFLVIKICGIILLVICIINNIFYLFTSLSCLYDMTHAKYNLQFFSLFSSGTQSYLDSLFSFGTLDLSVSGSLTSSYASLPVVEADLEVENWAERDSPTTRSQIDNTRSNRAGAAKAAAEAAIARLASKSTKTNVLSTASIGDSAGSFM